MARYVSLNLPGWTTVTVLGMMTCFSSSLRAQAPMQEQAAPVPAKTPAAPNSASTVPPPGAPPDNLGRYGKILLPGDEVAHPLKLKLPFPGAGEVKVPSPDELSMREKLEQLARLSDEEIHTQLEQWPVYSKMSLRDQAAMLGRIQDFRDYRTKTAAAKAHDMGLLTLTPDQKTKFEKDYWDKKLKMDQELVKQFGPAFKAREQKLEDELFREYSSASPGPVAKVPPAPATPPAPGQPVPPAKPPAPTPSGPPVAQSPH